MNLKKIGAIACAVLLSGIVFTGCKKEAPAASKEHIFEAKTLITSGEEFDSISNIAFDGTNLYFYANKWVTVNIPNSETSTPVTPIMPLAAETVAVVDEAEETEEVVDEADIVAETEAVTESYEQTYINTIYLLKADLDGNILKKVTLSEIPQTEEKYVGYSNLMVLQDGTVYATKETNIYGMDEEGNFNSVNKNELVSYDNELNEKVLFNVSDIISKALETDTTDFYVNRCVLDDSGNVYFNTSNGVYVIEPATGNVIFNYTLDATANTGNSNTYIQGIYKMPDGSVGVNLNEWKIVDNESSTKVTIAKINLSTGKLDEAQDFPIEYNAVPGVGDYSFFESNRVAVYGYDKDFANKSVVVDMLASSIGAMSINTLVPISADKFIISGYNETDGMDGVFLLEKVDPANVADKKVIKVAALRDEYELVTYIRNFNKASTEYQVEFVTYSSDPNSTNTQNLTTFNNEVISGNIPDVIVIDQNMPYDSYVAKGLLLNLKTRLNDDPELKLEDLVPSVVDKLSVEGKLYSLSPTFTVAALLGKQSIFGDELGQTFAELQSKAAEFPNAALFDPTTTREDFMVRFVYNYLGSYIDDATGKCYFNTPEFISLLNKAKSYPETFDYQDFDWSARWSGYRNDTILLEYYNMYNFREIVSETLSTFGAPVSILGYPGKEGDTGIIAELGLEVAIMAKSKNPDGAWQFVKSFITYKDPRQQDSSSERYNFPILKSELDKLAAASLERPYYTDYQTKEKVYYDNTAYIDDQEVKLPNNTPEDNAKVMKAIDNISSVRRSETDLEKIIRDDVKAFFNGQKSAEETAAIIQDRATTYVNESR
ncbi:MAG: hypothetical protein LBL98_08745 [Ruminococcus sp.]|jgi:ABC-type glycerol-3-phosphate transport system substrate-binding protein|nr:hypothetical protein [Ruminococcus sp.]